jgi:PBP1b-binding outer membrane lipoprotein LpoB
MNPSPKTMGEVSVKQMKIAAMATFASVIGLAGCSSEPEPAQTQAPLNQAADREKPAVDEGMISGSNEDDVRELDPAHTKIIKADPV